MFTFHWIRRMVALFACVLALAYSFVSIADVVSFAEGSLILSQTQPEERSTDIWPKHVVPNTTLE
jgi:hypothetical protein